ncbi:response regulator transcription factor [Vibrio harveyi]|uniref:response regulator transcription factor n=1 Tax=Vibrio harveyi TaxID=669 RepID=UPI003BB6BF4A
MPNVIIVEDDQQLRDMLCYFLSTVEGYEVSCLTSGENAVEHIVELNPELVLLDIQLPHTSGLCVLKSLREQGHHYPVIMMTANDNEITETNALVLGANDYITKPIRTNALRERIKRQITLARHYSHEVPSIDERPFILERKATCLLYEQVKIPLTPSEFELLEILSKESRPIPVHELFEQIHGFSYHCEDRSVYMRISSIRKKLASFLPDIDLVKNRRTKGFYLNYPVVVR